MAGTGINQERFNEVDFQKSLDIDDSPITAAVDGAGVDLKGFESATPFLDLGTQGGTSTPTTTFKLEESDDDVSYTVAPDRDVLGFTNSTGLVIGTGNDNKVHRAGYIGTKRYIRWAATAVSGTSPSLVAAGGVMRGDARRTPVAQ